MVIVLAGGGFDPDDIGGLLGAIKSDDALPPNPGGVAQLDSALRAIASAPIETPPTPLPDNARRVSGAIYGLDANPLGLRALSLSFDGGEPTLNLTFTDGHAENRPFGLNGQSRLSPGGRFGLPVALIGKWTLLPKFSRSIMTRWETLLLPPRSGVRRRLGYCFRRRTYGTSQSEVCGEANNQLCTGSSSPRS